MARVPRASLLCLLIAAPLRAQEPGRSLTLAEAIELGSQRNAALRAVRAGVRATEQRRTGSFSYYLPRVQTFASYLASDNTRGILLPAGSLGSFPELGGMFPSTDRNIPQGGSDLFFALTTVVQPLTHFFKIRAGRGVLMADEDAARAGLRRTEQEVILGITRAYAGLLLAQRGVQVARERVAAAELRLRYQTVAVTSGSAIEVAARDARVRVLRARQDLLEREGEVDDLSYALTDATGLPVGTRVDVSEPPVGDTTVTALPELLDAALRSNPDLAEARALASKADHGVGAAQAAYIPEIGLVGGHLYQNSIPFFPRHTLGVGISGSFTIFDFGGRERSLGERRAQLRQARDNLELVEGRVRGEVEAAYRKLRRARAVVSLAREALALRSEASRLEIAQSTVGYAVPAQEREARADRMEAEQDLLKAQLGELIARAELERAAGTLGQSTGR